MAADADAPERPLIATETDALPSGTAEPSRDANTLPTAGAGNDLDDLVDDDAATPIKRRMPPVRLAALIGLVMVLALGGLVGWLGFRTHQSREEQQRGELFLEAGRQGAVNLTTIDWQNVKGDIQRILDSATGQFHDQFSQRAQPFIDIVEKVQSKSVGTVTAAGLESLSDNDAQVLVAVSVKTTNLGAVDQPPQGWRMRIAVQKVDGGAKVSNVSFVPA